MGAELHWWALLPQELERGEVNVLVLVERRDVDLVAWANDGLRWFDQRATVKERKQAWQSNLRRPLSLTTLSSLVTSGAGSPKIELKDPAGTKTFPVLRVRWWSVMSCGVTRLWSSYGARVAYRSGSWEHRADEPRKPAARKCGGQENARPCADLRAGASKSGNSIMI